MSWAAVVLGVVNGLTYAILAVGLVLIFRANRFVNFAHGTLGGLVAVVFFKLIVDFDVPYPVALVVAVAGAAALGALVELTIIRRLFDAPPLVLVVATIALSQLFYFFSLLESLQPDRTAISQGGFPLAFHGSWKLAGVILTGAHLTVLVVVPAAAAAVTAFLRYTAYGQAIRAAADNPDAARLAGISVRRMSTVVWALAGVLAGCTAIMLMPVRGTLAVGTLGPSVMVRALGAGLVARMVSLPIAFGASIAIGVIESTVFHAAGLDSGMSELAVFGVVMVTLAVRGRQLSRSVRDRRGDAVGFGADLPPLRREWRTPQFLAIQRGLAGAGLVAVVVLPFVPVFGLNKSSTLSLLAIACAFGIVGVSLTVLTGWAGQVSLGQFALVGIGAVFVARFDDWPIVAAMLGAGAVASLASVVVGIPALRIQGLFLAVATLAFGVLATQYLFQEEFFVENVAGVFLDRPGVIRTERSVYFLALGLLAASVWVAANLRNSGPGRLLLAVRDNDAAARSAGISPMWTRMLAFAISGFMAGVAGSIFSYSRLAFVAPDFPPIGSLDILLMVAVGGLGSLSGALLGAGFLYGIPAIVGSSDLVTLFTSSVGVLIVLLYLPGGLGSVAVMVRDAVAERVHRLAAGLPPPERVRPLPRELWAAITGHARTDAERVAP